MNQTKYNIELLQVFRVELFVGGSKEPERLSVVAPNKDAAALCALQVLERMHGLQFVQAALHSPNTECEISPLFPIHGFLLDAGKMQKAVE